MQIRVGLLVGIAILTAVVGTLLFTSRGTLTLPAAGPLFPRVVEERSFQFTVAARKVYDQSVYLEQGQRLDGFFEAPKDVSFSLWSPFQRVLLRQERVVGQFPFSYQATETGDYWLRFDNTFSILTGKLVSLSYKVIAP